MYTNIPFLCRFQWCIYIYKHKHVNLYFCLNKNSIILKVPQFHIVLSNTSQNTYHSGNYRSASFFLLVSHVPYYTRIIIYANILPLGVLKLPPGSMIKNHSVIKIDHGILLCRFLWDRLLEVELQGQRTCAFQFLIGIIKTPFQTVAVLYTFINVKKCFKRLYIQKVFCKRVMHTTPSAVCHRTSMPAPM